MNYENKPFPLIEDIFEMKNSNEKYVFTPLVSINFKNHLALNNISFHFISVWDTGSYSKDYFNDDRLDPRVIRFRYKNNKYSYLSELNFPFITELKKAYELIENNFIENLEYYLTPKSHQEFEGILSKGGDLVHSKNEKFDKWDAEYYFEKITKYLYVKKKFEKFNKFNSSFTYSETFIGLTTTKKEVIEQFHSFGKDKSEIIKNVLEQPDWIQTPEKLKYENMIFIGSVSEYDFTNGTAELYLFWDKENDFVYQISQWT
jgi:hypothetical protein